MEKGKQKQPSLEITWSVLPSEIENNILSRLPVKSLMRFRCVCKHWCNLVTNPHFTKMHLDRSTQIKVGPKLARAFGSKGSNVFSIDVEASRNQCNKTIGQTKVKLQRKLVLPFKDTPLLVTGSCNGFLSIYTFDSLYLLNPATNEYRGLPFPHRINFLFTPTVFGFGYSPRTNEYKAMMIRYFRTSQPTGCDGVYAYTLGADSSWRSIGGIEYRFDQLHQVLVNGALHWMASGVPISFDLGDEKFRELSLPKCFSQQDINHPVGLVELDGFLSSYQHKDENFDIWVMKDYGDEQSWTKAFSVVLPILSKIRGLCKPLYILKKDEEILCESDNEFFILNVMTKKVDTIHPRYGPYDSGTQIYFESLVSLINDGGIDREATTNRTEGKRKEVASD